jgi:hypothetical protein
VVNQTIACCTTRGCVRAVCLSVCICFKACSPACLSAFPPYRPYCRHLPRPQLPLPGPRLPLAALWCAVRRVHVNQRGTQVARVRPVDVAAITDGAKLPDALPVCDGSDRGNDAVQVQRQASLVGVCVATNSTHRMDSSDDYDLCFTQFASCSMGETSCNRTLPLHITHLLGD